MNAERFIGASVRPVQLPYDMVYLESEGFLLRVGETVTTRIINGSGNYSVTCNTENVVKASIEGETLIITAINDGANTTVTVNDITKHVSTSIDVMIIADY